MVGDAQDKPLAVWLDNFRRDIHPEREVAVWEHLAMAFRAFCSRYRPMTVTQRREAYAFLTWVSLGQRWQEFSFKHIDEPDAARELLQSVYTEITRPRELQ